MAEYRYQYRHTNTPSTGTSGGGKRPQKNPDTGYWIITAFLFFVFPPAAVIMLVLKLASGDHKGQKQGQHPHDVRRQGAKTAAIPAEQDPWEQKAPKSQGTAAQQQKQAATPHDQVKIKNGTGLIIAGSILTATFGIASLTEMFDLIYYGFYGFYVLPWF